MQFPRIQELIDFFEVRHPPADKTEDEVDDMKFEHDNMANLLLFEVEVGGRSIVIGGFSTHGWVAGLNDNEDGEEDTVS